MSNIYVENGFKDRDDYRAYLKELADDYGVELSTVRGLASMLGPSEARDGLVSHLEDIVAGAY